MSTVTAPRPTRQRRQRPPRFFSITFRIEGVSYGIVPLRDVGPDTAKKAFRFLKKDPTGRVIERYDVRQDPAGHVECCCKGFLRWRYCKHVQTLTAAGMIEPAEEGGRP
jgi:hypothetical protein